MSDYIVTIHKTDGSIKYEHFIREVNAYAWVRMASNDKWRCAFISPSDGSHMSRQVHDDTWSASVNVHAKLTPNAATRREANAS